MTEQIDEERVVSYLKSYLYEISDDVIGLKNALKDNNALKNFPEYKRLLEVSENISKYLKFDTKSEVENLYRFLQKDVYILSENIDKYSENRLRQHHLKDEVTEPLKECEDLNSDIKATLGLLRTLYEIVPEKTTPIVPPHQATSIAIAAIFMAAMFIFTLKSAVIMNIPSSMGVMTNTGFASAPTGEFGGVNFEMFYILTSSMILSIYILGRVMKKW